MKKSICIVLGFALSCIWVSAAFSHCEIPCGIYGDEMRINQIAEHLQTIEKSMRSVIDLSSRDVKNYNQLVRWITNKETHATHIQDIVYQYFMTQRIKPVPPGSTVAYDTYITQLRLLHEMLIYAMKAKQTTDLNNVEKLRSLLKSFRDSYLGPEAKQ